MSNNKTMDIQYACIGTFTLGTKLFRAVAFQLRQRKYICI